MLIPSIDLMGGRIVQLVQGEKLKLAFDDFEYWIERFCEVSAGAVDRPGCGDAAGREPRADRDDLRAAALPGGRWVEDGGGWAAAAGCGGEAGDLSGRVCLVPRRTAEKRRHKVIRLEFAEELKRALGEEALCFSVDTKGGRVAVKGWKDSVDLTPEEAVTWLEDSCAAFLYTHVDTEGTMSGFPMDVAAVLRACTAKQLIVAGGIKERARGG